MTAEDMEDTGEEGKLIIPPSRSTSAEDVSTQASTTGENVPSPHPSPNFTTTTNALQRDVAIDMGDASGTPASSTQGIQGTQRTQGTQGFQQILNVVADRLGLGVAGTALTTTAIHAAAQVVRFSRNALLEVGAFASALAAFICALVVTGLVIRNGRLSAEASPSGRSPNETLPSGTLPSGRSPNETLPSGTLPSGTIPSNTSLNGTSRNGTTSEASRRAEELERNLIAILFVAIIGFFAEACYGGFIGSG